MLKDEMEVRDYLISRIEGFTGVYSNWHTFNTVDIIKVFLALGLTVEWFEF
jgi:hypothetical protein